MKKTHQPSETTNLTNIPFVVAIGASAGGLEAFRTFFSAMPVNSGMAFVLVQHLAPDHASMLVELLSKYTEMIVMEAKDGMELAANQVFVIPPNATLSIEKGRLVVATPAPPRETRRPIDTFLFSLAQDQGENAACVILSGTGSDGSLGLVAVKEEGGITIAQAEPEAEKSTGSDKNAMSGMPSSAAATGQVDYILSVEEIPAKLVEYHENLSKIEHSKTLDDFRQDAADYLPAIFALIHAGVGHDFSHYKVKTLVRRVQRRMQMLQINTVSAYIALLKKDSKELELLFRDILIGVTEFFRDSAAFQALEESVIPKLMEQRMPGEPIRVWVPACATGDEAYSIAILLAEALEKAPPVSPVMSSTSPKVLIFATDINDRAVAVAREGRYLKSHLDGVSPERLKRWFIQEGSHYCVVPQIREMCVFSVHSLVKDPPFSKLNLISCRNLLIYLDVVLQDGLIPMFHYALKPGGFLFLGLAESVGRQSLFFKIVDEKYKLFVRRDETPAVLPHLTGSGLGGNRTLSSTVSDAIPLKYTFERGARRIMERYSPAHIVIDRHHRILSFSGQTGKYLDPSPGEASLDFFTLIQKALRPAARSLLQEAFATGQRTVKEKIPFEVNGTTDTVTLIVEPILPATGQPVHYIVVFQPADNQEISKGDVPSDWTQPDVQQLEHEIQRTRARLQAALDQAEEINEELKSSNEEFQSLNEELHSSNEELETSKEEMQSINEELQTVNYELKNKNDTLIRVNNDIQNLLESTEIATMFLDEQFCVRNFTPSITKLFYLRESDMGRPVTEISNRLNYDGLEDDIRKTLRSLTITEREFYIPETDSTFVMYIRPYRTVTKVVDGVVITFIDVTSKRHEAELSRLAAIVDSSNDAIIGHSTEGIITSWNAGAQQIFGYTAEEALGQSFFMLVPENRVNEMRDIFHRLDKGERIPTTQSLFICKDRQTVDVSLTISTVRSRDGKVIGGSTVARDMTEWVRYEHQRDLLLAELNHRVKNTLAIIQSISRQTARQADSLESFSENFEARILALSRTHNLLVESHWQGAALEQVLKAELLPYEGPHLTLHGEAVQLNPGQVIALGMIFHELTTNAAKYGALSVPTGRVEVSWRVEAQSPPDRMLIIQWSEIGGPVVSEPKRRGFGSRLIEHSLEREKQGMARLEFEPAGVRCCLQFILDGAAE